MNKTLRLGILHYHLKSGGVRTVMTNALQSLIAHGRYSLLEIDIITCDAAQNCGDVFFHELLEWAKKKGPSQVRFSQVEIPELSYHQEPAPDRQTLEKEAGYIAEGLLGFMNLERSADDNPYILHVHNGNLGKNPRLTLALKLLLNRLENDDLPAAIFHQMHDFAEDHRPECWKALRECTGESDPTYAAAMMYPPAKTARLHWATINTHDKDTLAQTGLAPDRISVLPNCIATGQLTAKPLTAMTDDELNADHITPLNVADDLKNRIDKYARNEGFRFSGERKILLYPVKTIRRKNIVEAVLLLQRLNHLDDRYQLLITLPANNPRDTAYARQIEQFVRDHQLPVIIGFGRDHISPGADRDIEAGHVLRYSLIDLFALCERVLTTSFQEGFGYVFHEAWLTGKPLIGRDIPHLTCDFRQEGLHLDHLYRHCYIPFAWIEQEWPRLLAAYIDKIQNMYRELGRPQPDTDTLTEQITCRKIVPIDRPDTAAVAMIDFADLDLQTQLQILQSLQTAPSRFESLHFDYDGPDRPAHEPACPQPKTIHHNRHVVIDKYGMKHHGEIYAGILATLAKTYARPAGSARPDTPSNEAIFMRSFDMERTRLLI